jgi:hypothetical protein
MNTHLLTSLLPQFLEIEKPARGGRRLFLFAISADCGRSLPSIELQTCRQTCQNTRPKTYLEGAFLFFRPQKVQGYIAGNGKDS